MFKKEDFIPVKMVEVFMKYFTQNCFFVNVIFKITYTINVAIERTEK